MKIRIKDLRQLIREAMEQQLPPGGSVVVEFEGGRALQVNILEEGKPKAHSPGVIRLERRRVPGGNVWEVVHSAARRGYGPMLYDLAMEVVVGRLGDLGITPDTSMVSDEALGVWKFYLTSRPDVEKEALPADIFSGAGSRPEALRYYYYKVGTPILNALDADGLVEMMGL